MQHKKQIMIVLKFGGTSVGSAERMRSIASLISGKAGTVVVLSAMSGVTDKLVATGEYFRSGDALSGAATLDLIRKRFEQTCLELFDTKTAVTPLLEFISNEFSNIGKRLQPAISDETTRWLIVQGEMITSRIFTEYLNFSGEPATLLNAVDFMQLDAQGEPDLAAIRERILPLVAANGQGLIITQGFVCLDHTGAISNLQRGGSDYSATLIGAAVQAERIEIWTDIDGMQNIDPRVVEHTYPVRSLSFDEAAELAYFGAKILHPACVWPAQQAGIPIWLKNTMHPENPGTIIHPGGRRNDITAVAAKDHITAIRIRSGRMLNTYGFLSKLFGVFEDFQTPIDMITTSEVAVSLTIDNDRNLSGIVEELQKLGTVEVHPGQTIICVVGDFLVDRYGNAARILGAMESIPVRMISYGGSSNNITFLVSTSDKNRALNRLNAELFPVSKIPAHVYS